MNRTLWKLDRIGERLWILAALTATYAASLTKEGKGLAVVADETRQLANKINNVVEKAMFDGEDIDKDKIMPLALELNLLALNSAIETNRIGYQVKQALVCAEEIRILAYNIVCLFDKESAEKKRQAVTPWPANPLSTANQGCFFLQLNIGGIQFVETLDNVREICWNTERKNGNIILRSMEIPLIDGFKMLGEKQESLTHVILWTPWAEQNKTYAVTADVSFIFFSPIGKPVDVPADMPLAKYVRECWENENGDPFYFMDWTKMIQSENE